MLLLHHDHHSESGVRGQNLAEGLNLRTVALYRLSYADRKWSFLLVTLQRLAVIDRRLYF